MTRSGPARRARSARRRVLLLNPPGSKPYARDLFLSGEFDPELRLPPEELALASGVLARAGFTELFVVDAVAEKLSPQACLARSREIAPDAIVFMTSAASYAEDAALAARLKSLPGAPTMVGIGDVYRDMQDLAFGIHAHLDAMLLDPASDALARVLEDPSRPVDGALARVGGAIIGGRRAAPRGRWLRALPRWDLFPLGRYQAPFLGGGPLATIAGEYGCAYLCSYCPMSSVGHRVGEVDDFVVEARALAKLGVRKLFVRDQSFGLDRARTLRLLAAWKSEGLGQSWIASTRADLCDEPLLRAMKDAGCVAVQIGVDSGDDEVLRVLKKNTTLAQARAAAAAARAAGLSSWGLFVLGLGVDTADSADRTLKAARELPFDRVTVSVDAQRHGTGFRKELLIKGLVPPEAMPPEVPTSASVWQGRLGISNADVFERYQRQRAREPRAGAPV